MRRFFISDLHLGHKNIILYENRPFGDCEFMKNEIVKRWNNAVSKHDMVFVLGDVAFGKENLDAIATLNGRKILVLGNHDTLSAQTYLDAGFESVSKWPIILDDFYICSHEPIYLNTNMPYANIHGHLHWRQMQGGAYFNVSVERINYTPINFDEIKKVLQKRG